MAEPVELMINLKNNNLVKLTKVIFVDNQNGQNIFEVTGNCFNGVEQSDMDKSNRLFPRLDMTCILFYS